MSGMLLEAEAQTIDTQSMSITRQFSYIVVDTNIFGPNSGTPVEYLYVAAAVTVSLVAVIVLAIKRRSTKKGKTKRRGR